MRPRRGEVWWGEEPERERRPYLILTRNSAIGKLNEVLVAAVTRTIRSIPTEVEIDESDGSDGMPVACVVSLDNLLMMPLGQLTKRVCDLSAERMAEVCAALAAATEC